ncbi:AI-2E family transporter [Pantoea sp. FN0305]|uniref:AI-2E family transporter n=1 Tax=Pantoea sp. FN0305 TaxID=3418559 RepID=UPI003CF909F0
MSLPQNQACTLASFAMSAATLMFIMHFHLLAGVFFSFFIYSLLSYSSKKLKKFLPESLAKLLAVLIVLCLLGIGFFYLLTKGVNFFSSGFPSSSELINSFSEILKSAGSTFHLFSDMDIPESFDEFKYAAIKLIKYHISTFALVGKNALHLAATVVIGLIIALMIFLQHDSPPYFQAPLTQQLSNRVSNFYLAFKDFFHAQIKISLLNTFFTTIFLFLVLPVVDIALPYKKTIILATFFLGLLPVVGNLISNTIITFIALSISLKAALLSILFLIIIHKLEYLFNANFLGKSSKVNVWEIILAMVVLETVWGIAGVVAAPVFYSYIKTELAQLKLV